MVTTSQRDRARRRGRSELMKRTSGTMPRISEALLIKQLDSKTHGVAARTPHSAFSAKENSGPTRQSIEVRRLVFWGGSAAGVVVA